MITRTALALAILATSSPLLAAAPQQLASLTPVMVESRGTLTTTTVPTTVSAQAAATAAVVPDSLPAATPAPGTGKGSDIVWRKILLGTWQAVDTPEATTINGEATFTPDGRAAGYTTATYAYQDGTTSDVKISMNFRWRLENGVVILDQFDSDPPGFIKKTQVRRFQIVSMNDTGAVFKDLDDGQEIYRRRKPG